MTSKPKNVPIKWNVPTDISTHYVTNIVVQKTADEVYLSFFECVPPLILGSAAEQARQMDSMHDIEAKCVSRIALTQARARSLLQVLATQLEPESQK